MTWTALSEKQKVRCTVLGCVVVLSLTVGIFIVSTLNPPKSEAEIRLASIISEYGYVLESVDFQEPYLPSRPEPVTVTTYRTTQVDEAAAKRILELMSEDCRDCTVSPFMFSMGVQILGDGIMPGSTPEQARVAFSDVQEPLHAVYIERSFLWGSAGKRTYNAVSTLSVYRKDDRDRNSFLQRLKTWLSSL